MTEETKKSVSKALDSIREFTKDQRRRNDQDARARETLVDEARVPEDKIAEMHNLREAAAKDVEVCDTVLRKLDEVGKEFGEDD